MAEKAKKFKAGLEKLQDGLGWTIARVPFEPREAWPKMLRLRVKGEVNGVAFRTSLFPFTGGGGYFLLVTKAVQQGAGIALGSVAEFKLEPDMEARPAELPDELAVLLEEETGLRQWYDALSENRRREIGKWILSVKSDDAKRRRAEQMAERLLGAMEAEKELPPVIVAAFKRRPKAKAGWAKMTVYQRQSELMAVYYYQTVEARDKRVEKLCDTAEKKV